MTSIRWLHLTDLHIGMREQDTLWPRMRDKFFDDLARLYERCGSWDLVLFTGDLTNRGKQEEFEQVDRILDELWEKFDKLDGGFNPKFLAVPGNHDLVRPDQSEKFKDTDYQEAVNDLISLWEQRKDRFWQDAESRYRQVVIDAFINYTNWWNNQKYRPKDEEFNVGLLPGEFSWTFTKGDAKIGFLGLNTSFRQVSSKVSQGDLSLGLEQFQGACDPDGSRWCRKHHTCLLLTHHPQKWLDGNSQRVLRGEIIPDYFSLHLCGHLHEVDYQENAEAGNDSERSWLGRSLFGIEYYGEKGTNEEYQRSHGYTAGRIDLMCQTNEGRLFFWPREARQQGGWGRRNIVPDYSINLEDEQNTELEEIKLIRNYESDASPDLLPNLQLDISECRNLMRTVRRKDDEIDAWKKLHEDLQQGCHLLALNQMYLKQNNEQTCIQRGSISSLITMCIEIKATLLFEKTPNTNNSVREKLQLHLHKEPIVVSLDYIKNNQELWEKDIDEFCDSLKSLNLKMNSTLNFIDGELKKVLQQRSQLLKNY
ncbi:MAG: metallophosphoesterase [Crocosphaera sp.]|nr:metallophosphoesterase [Crocosphaera sp.]